jgi:hypothetical protein
VASGGSPRVLADAQIGTPVSVSAIQVAAANAAAVATLPAVAGKTNYLTGFYFTAGNGLSEDLTCTIVGVLGGTWSFVLALSANQSVAPVCDSLVQPFPASAVNTALVATIPASGVGGGAIAIVLTGYAL